MQYLILIIVAVISFWLGRKTKKGIAPLPPEGMQALRDESRKALNERTHDRKEKILEFMKKEAVHKDELETCGIDTSREEFDREDVENLLDVSGNTARKYLNELEIEGKIKQVGEQGPKVYYVLTK